MINWWKDNSTWIMLFKHLRTSTISLELRMNRRNISLKRITLIKPEIIIMSWESQGNHRLLKFNKLTENWLWNIIPKRILMIKKLSIILSKLIRPSMLSLKIKKELLTMILLSKLFILEEPMTFLNNFSQKNHSEQLKRKISSDHWSKPVGFRSWTSWWMMKVNNLLIKVQTLDVFMKFIQTRME